MTRNQKLKLFSTMLIHLKNNNIIAKPIFKHMSQFFARRFKFSIDLKLPISLPAILGQDKKLIQAYVSYTIEGYKIPQYIKSFLKVNIMRTFKAQPNIKVLLCNNISFGKKVGIKQTY